MEYLWRASQDFRNQAFVSVYNDDMSAWKGNRFFLVVRSVRSYDIRLALIGIAWMSD